MLVALDLLGRLLVAGALAWAAVAKLGDLAGLRATLYLSRITRPWVPQITVALPSVELVLAATLLTAGPGWVAALAAAVLLLAFTVFLAADPHAGEGCNCFGRRSAAGRRGGIVRDVLLLVALAPALVRGPGAGRVGVPDAALAAYLVPAVTAVVALLTLTFRRDRDARAGGLSGRRRAGVPPTPPVEVRRDAPPFDLPTLDGGRVGLVPGSTLLFVEPGCVLCEQVLPGVVDSPDVVVLAAGTPDAVAELAARHGLPPHRVGVDERGAVADAYEVPATPAACRIGPSGILVDGAGWPAARPAVGTDAVQALLGATDR